MNNFRKKRFAQFINLLEVDNKSRIIDFGGLPYDWISIGFSGEVLCVSMSRIKEGEWGEGNIQYKRMNLLENTFKDNEFDICYSNSLIEHVGIENQQKIANEIMRISNKYWVQVPYRYFLLEPHYRFPFFHELPLKLKHLIARKWTPYFVKKNYYLDEVDSMYLPKYDEYKKLFNNGRVIKEK